MELFLHFPSPPSPPLPPLPSHSLDSPQAHGLSNLSKDLVPNCAGLARVHKDYTAIANLFNDKVVTRNLLMDQQQPLLHRTKLWMTSN